MVATVSSLLPPSVTPQLWTAPHCVSLFYIYTTLFFISISFGASLGCVIILRSRVVRTHEPPPPRRCASCFSNHECSTLEPLSPWQQSSAAAVAPRASRGEDPRIMHLPAARELLIITGSNSDLTPTHRCRRRGDQQLRRLRLSSWPQLFLPFVVFLYFRCDALVARW